MARQFHCKHGYIHNPELFATVYSGVSAGCFESSTNQVDAWNSSCAQGQIIRSQQQWADVVRGMYPGYSGAHPRVQIYHGSADATLLPQNYNETIKQWTGVFGYNLKPQQELPNTPQQGYTTEIYGPNVQGIYAKGCWPHCTNPG